MERSDLLSPRRAGGGLTRTEIARRLASRGPPGERRAPGARDPARQTGRAEAIRGDHDLNPGLYPDWPLVPAAVLVAVVEHRDHLALLLTRRTDHLHDHAGQISFPGGRLEAHDPTPEHAALREAEEEVGLPPDRVELIGRLDTYVTRTGYRVTPCVGFVEAPYPVARDPFEVAEVFEVPLDFLLDPRNCRLESRIYEGETHQFYAMPYVGRYIWGATAGMIVNLCEIMHGSGTGAEC
jgi:8-oxo-dGTP pyrophosphatase MutT (NUDIX family)